jgi:homocysteine S-methyltransferase
MPNPIERSLAAQDVLVLDGALATELERRGADLRDPLWSARCLIEQPDLIRTVHRDYFDAGADVATTATYQATFEGFAARGIAREEAARLMRSAVRLALEARDEFCAAQGRGAGRLRPLVAASVGPYGAMLADGSEYRGRYPVSDADLERFHRPRMQLLAASGADLLACETIPCLREALILARLIALQPAMTGWISFSCRDGARNAEGEDIGACAAALAPFAAIGAIGVNCTRPEYVAELLGRLRASTDKPLVAYPNSGERYDAAARAWHGTAHVRPFADFAQDWYAAGARLIGGCCRTTPEDIRALRARCAPQRPAAAQ